MFEKHNFINNFALATILAFVLGFTLENSWRHHVIPYTTAIVGLQVIALGTYSLFIQNEFLNTPALYQVTVIALITGYQVISSIENTISFGYSVYVHHLNLAWALIAVGIHTKCPELLIKLLRFDIGYSVSFFIVNRIPVINSYSGLISAIIGLGFIFVLHLTFNRIAIYSSIYLYSFMIVYGLETVIREFFHLHKSIGVIIGIDVLTALIFVGGLYCHCKQNNTSEGPLLGSQASYSTFGAEA